jgi:hypothetical protein
MVKLWHESEQQSGSIRPPVQAITRDVFFMLSDKQREYLLQDFLVIKDTNVSLDFLPQLVRLFLLHH